MDSGGPDHSQATRMTEWQDSPGKRLLARLALPVFYALNRPSMQWFGRLAYDFALRCNGFAITFKGRDGLTLAEEKFLAGFVAARRPRTVFDVGANNGAYTRLVRKLAPDAAIYAFEPHPTSFSLLQRDVAGTNAVLVNKALSDHPGELPFYDLAGHDGSTQASLSRDAVGLFSEGVVEHTVSVTTLDTFVEENGIQRIDLLKIDTEGFDLAVLAGALKTLGQGRIDTIQFEFIPANIVTKTRVRDFIELLAPTHTIHRLCLNGSLIKLGSYDVKRAEIYVIHNLIAVPKVRPGG